MSNQQVDISEIWVKKDDVSNTKVVNKKFETDQLEADEVMLKIDSFGFSANNITYSVFGDKMGYWGFFPANSEWGIVPVWGFATVLASANPRVKSGDKVYGFLPMASHWVIKPGNESKQGFVDTHQNRKSISPVYDSYLYCATDPGYRADREPWQLNYRPLFMTSFVLDDFVGEGLLAASEEGNAIKQVILTSASSKTAYGAAHLLLKHKAERGLDYEVIGLTSTGNKDFTEGLACYDKVFAYDEVEDMNSDQASWTLDFAGNKSLLLQLQEQLAQHLVKLVLIGSTDVDAQQDKPVGNLESEFFFAPSQVKKRMGEWGSAGFTQRYAAAWQGFAAQLGGNLEVAEYVGAETIQKIYLTGLEGKLNNKEINVLSFD